MQPSWSNIHLVNSFRNHVSSHWETETGDSCTLHSLLNISLLVDACCRGALQPQRARYPTRRSPSQASSLSGCGRLPPLLSSLASRPEKCVSASRQAAAAIHCARIPILGGSLQLLQDSAFALAPHKKGLLQQRARGKQDAGNAAMTTLQAAGQLDAYSQVSR